MTQEERQQSVKRLESVQEDLARLQKNILNQVAKDECARAMMRLTIALELLRGHV